MTMAFATWLIWLQEVEMEGRYRDLETVQTLRRKHVDPKFVFQPDDLRLPHRLLEARRKKAATETCLTEITTDLIEGRLDSARSGLGSLAW